MRAFLLAILVPLASTAGGDELDKSINAHFPKLESLYHELHQHPELSMQEKWTAARMAKEFRALGLDTQEVGGGVVGILRNGASPVTLVRSELDGLPVQEKTGVAYQSQIPGVMHACGHDLHMTALIGTIQAMQDNKAKWKGTLVFVAQPGEELVKGAKSMLDAGLLAKIPKLDYAVALHDSAAYPPGTVSMTAGPTLATVDSLNVTLRGKGSHGAAPHMGVDPIVLAADFIMHMQTLISRERNPVEPEVITIGSIHAGTKHNIIPDEAKLQLTVRTYNEAERTKLLKRIKEVAQGLARVANAPEPSLEIVESSPATENDPVLAARFENAIATRLGKDKVVTYVPMMAAEDFGQFGLAAKVPSLFFFVGARMHDQPSVGTHSPLFAPDFKTVGPTAIRAMVSGLEDLHRL